ncbi:MAG: arginine--tRNA ligase [Candidatus Eremiobacteraeota bacterium]|nr:arginine--tRNA ligase [Candidatus Eremiobacteraeota bacterium]
MNPITTEAHGVLPDVTLETFSKALARTISALYPDAPVPAIVFEAPRRPEFGDFATNVALQLARVAKRSPQDVATAVLERTFEAEPGLRAVLSEAQPVAGFINIRLSPACWQSNVARILREGDGYGRAAPNGTRISLEYGSANPTGPLVVVQGRTLSIGQTLADVMRFRGFDVTTEWIINDEGAQMETLARSLYARYRQTFDPAFPFPQDGYPAGYLLPIAGLIAGQDGEKWVNAGASEWTPYFAQFGRDRILEGQHATARRFGAMNDLWQSEKELHESGRVKEDLQRLTELGLTYESEGALFFRAEQFGDDKDRVIVRSDGRTTYYGADIAYHYEKLKRADKVIDILGPDHHGYIGRIKGVAEALGYPGHLDVFLSQQISLMRGDEEVAMSKRAGNIVTLDDILDEVGVDAARFFFVMLAPESPFKFDLALAKEQNNANPVYYVQYGHARIASVFKNAAVDEPSEPISAEMLAVLSHPTELALARRLSELPSTLDNVVKHYAPHRLTHYAREVASDFHQFYSECKILVEDRTQRVARLALCRATKTVLATALRLTGVSAPETM